MSTWWNAILTIFEWLSIFNFITHILLLYIYSYVVYFAVNKALSMWQFYKRYFRIFARIRSLFETIGGGTHPQTHPVATPVPRDAGAKAEQGGLTGTKGHWRPHSANIYYPLSQSCTAYISRYWLCIDKGIKWLGEFLSILNTKCLQLYFQAEIQYVISE